MERTTNLNLPQWEAHDPIRREDFNAAMASIDANATQVEAVSIDTADFVAGDTVYTFSKAPKIVLLRGVYVTLFLLQGSTCEGIDYYTTVNDYRVAFRLEGTSLIMTKRTNISAANPLIITAFF